MFDRFTNQARQVVVQAQTEARAFGHDHIGTEHILLALLADGETGAAQALGALGVAPEQARTQVEEIKGRGGLPQENIPFTPRARAVFHLAGDQAMMSGEGFIGPEHILLGLLHEGSGTGVRALQNLGVNSGDLRKRVNEALGAPSGTSALFARLRRKKFR
jgi:ATP-dependent Clp protease ATP-binding subunit ClpC